MMKHRKNITSILTRSMILSAAFCLLMACDKSHYDLDPSDEVKLPWMSFEGKQSLGCLVNDELFVSKPYEVFLVGNFKPRAIRYSDSILYIRANDKYAMKGASLGMAVIHEKGRTSYPLDFRLANFRTHFIDNSPLGGKQYELLESEPHKLLILNENDSLIAGLFHFSAVSSDGDTVRIRDGRFDLRKEP